MLYNKVKKLIFEKKLIGQNDNVLVCVSGGKDSACLLDILSKLQNEVKFKLFVCHVNHHLRGKESTTDKDFTKNLARTYKLDFYEADIYPAKSNLRKEHSLEDAARILRYAQFKKIADKIGATKIALAHNMHDQAETLLIRFLNGSGPTGLAGMELLREDKIIRPLLYTTPNEIRTYLKENRLKHRTDSSNADEKYKRNFIRNRLIPIIEKDLNPNLCETLSNASTVYQWSKDFFDKIVKEKYRTIVNDNSARPILYLAKLNREPNILKFYFIKDFCEKAIKLPVPFKTLYLILEILNKTGCKEISLPNGFILQKTYKNISLTKKTNCVAPNLTTKKIKIPGKASWDKFGFSFKKKRLNGSKIKFNKNNGKIVLDYDKLKHPLFIRTHKNGDRFSPLGMSGKSKKIQDYFTDAKIEKNDRLKLPLIVSGNTIAYIPDYTISDNFKVTDKTVNILEIEVFKWHTAN